MLTMLTPKHTRNLVVPGLEGEFATCRADGDPLASSAWSRISAWLSAYTEDLRKRRHNARAAAAAKKAQEKQQAHSL